MTPNENRCHFSVKEVLEVFGCQKSRDLICIYHPAKYDKIGKPITLNQFYVNVVKALGDRPPPPPPLIFGCK